MKLGILIQQPVCSKVHPILTMKATTKAGLPFVCYFGYHSYLFSLPIDLSSFRVLFSIFESDPVLSPIIMFLTSDTGGGGANGFVVFFNRFFPFFLLIH